MHENKQKLQQETGPHFYVPQLQAAPLWGAGLSLLEHHPENDMVKKITLVNLSHDHYPLYKWGFDWIFLWCFHGIQSEKVMVHPLEKTFTGYELERSSHVLWINQRFLWPWFQ